VVIIAYVTIQDIKTLVSFPDNITDQAISDLIPLCTAELNADINVLIVREYVDWLDETRENYVNSDNATYYVKDWKNYYIGDSSNNGTVDTSDVLVTAVDSDGTETEPTISSITHDDGKIVMSSAPDSGLDLYITYSRAPIDESTPHSLIKIAMAQLVGAYSFLRVDAKLIERFRIGKVSVGKQSGGFDKMYKAYRMTVNRILKDTIEAGEGQIIIAKRGEA